MIPLQDNSTVTATRICTRDGSHTETETDTAVQRIITKSPTSTAKGTFIWQSKAFENECFTVQTKTGGEIPALSEMTTIRLPAGLKTVEANAFEGLAAQAVIIPSGCTSIGSEAFANCPNLLYVQIPASVTIIDNNAFSGSNRVVIDRK